MTEPQEGAASLPESDHQALKARLFSELYDDLRRFARSRLAPRHTCQPTTLVNEAFLRVVSSQRRVADRGELFALAATAMRNIMVDHARRRTTRSRHLSGSRVPLDDVVDHLEAQSASLIDVDAALERLKSINPLLTRVLELRVYCGCTIAECALMLGCPQRTTYRLYETARTLLRMELRNGQ